MNNLHQQFSQVLKDVSAIDGHHVGTPNIGVQQPVKPVVPETFNQFSNVGNMPRPNSGNTQWVPPTFNQNTMPPMQQDFQYKNDHTVSIVPPVQNPSSIQPQFSPQVQQSMLPTAHESIAPPAPTDTTPPTNGSVTGNQSFFAQHKSMIIIAVGVLAFAIIGFMVFNKMSAAKKQSKYDEEEDSDDEDDEEENDEELRHSGSKRGQRGLPRHARNERDIYERDAMYPPGLHRGNMPHAPRIRDPRLMNQERPIPPHQQQINPNDQIVQQQNEMQQTAQMQPPADLPITGTGEHPLNVPPVNTAAIEAMKSGYVTAMPFDTMPKSPPPHIAAQLQQVHHGQFPGMQQSQISRDTEVQPHERYGLAPPGQGVPIGNTGLPITGGMPPQQPGMMGPPPPQQPGMMGPPQQPGMMGPPQQPGMMGPPPQQQPGMMGPPPPQQPGMMGPPPQQQPGMMGPPQQPGMMGPPQQPGMMGPPPPQNMMMGPPPPQQPGMMGPPSPQQSGPQNIYQGQPPPQMQGVDMPPPQQPMAMPM